MIYRSRKYLKKSMYKFDECLEKMGEVGYVDQVVHSIIRIKGLPGVRASEVVMFETGELGQVIALVSDEMVEILPLSKGLIRVGDRVARTGLLLSTKVGEKLLGKTIDPLGRVIDGDGVIGSEGLETRPIDQEPAGILDREGITEAFEVGVPVVDLMVPLGKGQRQLLVGDRKTGKTQFLMQVILSQAKKGVVSVYVGIGKRKSDIKRFEEFIKTNGLEKSMVLVTSTSDDAAGLIYLTPYSGMTQAEFFRDQGKDVLIIFDDLTTHARFYREISLLAQRFPGRSSYPGDIFYIHARLLERAGKFAKGSITALPIAETVLSDLSGYIQTNLMAMTDGHLFFDSDFFNQGRRPALNPFLSVTRVGLQAQTPLIRDLSRQLNGFMVKQERLRQFMHFGAELSEAIKRDLDLGDRLTAFFDQSSTTIIPMSVAVLVVGCLWASLWRDITVQEMKAEIAKVMEAYQTREEYQKKIDQVIADAAGFSVFVEAIKNNPSLISREVVE